MLTHPINHDPRSSGNNRGHLRAILALALATGLMPSLASAEDLTGEGLFPTTFEELPREDRDREAFRDPDDPRPLRPTVEEPMTQRQRRSAREQEAVLSDILIPTPEPVAEGLREPHAPAIVFEETQEGLVPEEEVEVEEEAPVDPGQMLREGNLEAVGEWLEENEDAPLANALGWAYFNRDNTEESSRWFEQALRWDETIDEAAYGLALSLFREGFIDQAESVALWKINQFPAMGDILGDVHMTRAISSFRAEDYSETLDELRRARSFRPSTRGERILEAWAHYHLRNVQEAHTRFLNLYREELDEPSAVGLYATLSREQDWDRIRLHVDQLGGPLAEIYARFSSERYFDRRLYLRAYKVAPEQYPQLENIDGPTIGLTAEGISRRGDSGIDKLVAVEGPRVSATFYQDTINRFEIGIGVVSLNAGSLPERAFIGTVPPDFATNPNVRYLSEPKTRYVGMTQPYFAYYREGWFSPFAEAGTTPIGGAVDPTYIGRVGFDNVFDTGVWRLELYRESKKESLLSYTGIRDPYTGRLFGRAVDTGIRASLFHAFSEELNFGGTVAFGEVSGESIPDNQHLHTNFALMRVFYPDGFHYLNFGPVATFYGYSKNLGNHTFGHGGYFSPSIAAQGTFNLQAMTLEGKSYLVKGEFGLGVQSNNQDSAALFPTEPDGRTFRREDETSLIMISDLQALFRLTENWSFGANIGYNVTPSYEEFRGGIFTTFHFSPRAGLFESDFPGFRPAF